jgi:glyoxylase-like metal-dependent hydrolase (beta-lactamase superfamily II)
VRALALHPDVLLVSSALLQVNCVIVRGGVQSRGAAEAAETFVIDSPLLPDELDALPALIEQARFPTPSGLLATHGDWDHLLGRLAFPSTALGCGEATAKRLQAGPGTPQRELRAFDEELMIERIRPLALGSLQPLPVPGRCAIGDRELEIHPAAGHTADGIAILVGWAGVLVAGDYLSPLELPTLSDGGEPGAYCETLERLRGLSSRADHVVPGHGPALDCQRELGELGSEAKLPAGRRAAVHRRQHEANVAAL